MLAILSLPSLSLALSLPTGALPTGALQAPAAPRAAVSTMLAKATWATENEPPMSFAEFEECRELDRSAEELTGVVEPTITPQQWAVAEQGKRIAELRREGLAAIERRTDRMTERGTAAARVKVAQIRAEGSAVIANRALITAKCEKALHLLRLKADGAATVARREEATAAFAALAPKVSSAQQGAAPSGFEWGGVF